MPPAHPAPPARGPSARRRIGTLARAGLCAGAVAALAAAGLARAATPGDAPEGCQWVWRVTADLAASPRQLQVELSFEAGRRSPTLLRLPAGWAALAEAGDAPRLQAVAGAPQLRSLAHAPGERVTMQWRLQGPAEGLSGVRLAPTWLAFGGAGLLPVPDGAEDGRGRSACIGLAGPPAAGSRWVSSHGMGQGEHIWWRVAEGPAPLAVRVQQAVYAGGALRVGDSGVAGVTAAMPQDLPWRFGVDALAEASARAVAAQRRYWGDTGAGRPWLVLLLPDAGAAQGATGVAGHQALALQASTELAVPGAGFDGLIAQALARAWLADRFGPLAHAGRGDEGLRAWFSEGFAEFLAHRALLREGQWTPEDYAAALNRKIERYLDASAASPAAGATRTGADATPDAAGAAARGEWLALRWQGALRAAGRPGLEALLQRQLVPAAQASREGPISAPLATHRLLAAVRPVFDDAALGDIRRYIDQGDPFEFGRDTLGPCFVGQRQPVGRWELGFDPLSLGQGVVAGVLPGGPADAAGLRDGMRLAGHALSPGDASQPVVLQVMGADGQRVEIRYLPAVPPLRELPRYRPVAQALQQGACLGWLGLGPDAAAALTASQAAALAGQRFAVAPRATGKPAGKAAARGGKPKSKATGKSTRSNAAQVPAKSSAPRSSGRR